MAQGTSDQGKSAWKSTLTWAFRSTRVMTFDGLRPATVLVKAGKIIAVADWNDVPASAHLRDYGDYVILPGLVDTHVHINEAGSEKPGRADWEGFKTAKIGRASCRERVYVYV